MNIEQAKQIPIEEILERLGHVPVRSARNQLWYASPFRKESTPSFKVNRSMNAWYDFGQGQGGDGIDLVMRFERLASVSDTLARMDELVGAAVPPPLAPSARSLPHNAPALELVSVGPVTSRSLRSYLTQRGIAQAAAAHVQEVHYRHQDKAYFALGLANDSGGYELRNPFFKGTLGSKDISVIRGSPERVAVFEGLFDYLTALQLAGGKLEETAVVLNSVALREKAAERIRELHPDIVELYRDRDAAGEQLLTFFHKALPGTKIVDKSDMHVGHNDLNDWMTARGR